MKATFKTKDGNSVVIDTDEVYVDSIAIKDFSFKRENFELTTVKTTYTITLVSKETKDITQKMTEQYGIEPKVYLTPYVS